MSAARPLAILTRPEAAGSALDRTLGEAGVEVIRAPLLRIEPLPGALPDPAPDIVLFTSAQAARVAGAAGFGRGRPALCVGDRTAAAAAEAGLAAESAAGDVEALLAVVLARRPAGQLCHLRGEHSRGNLAERLTAAGLPCAEAVVYRQVPVPLTEAAKRALQGERPVLLPVFSPRTAALLVAAAAPRAPVHLVAMSGAVAEAAAGWPWASVTCAETPDLAAMSGATLAALATIGQPSLEGREGRG